MSRRQLNITYNTKNQKNHNIDEKRQLTHQKYFKMGILTMCQQPNTNYLETNEKSQRRNRSYIKEPRENYRTEKYNKLKKSLPGVNSRVEMTG